MMHSFATLLLVILATAPATSPHNLDNFVADHPVEWVGETTVDLGDLLHHQDAVHVFEFRNMTETPLLIDNIRVGCGCTAADWADQPVQPGEIGKVKVNYDAARIGYFRKYVKVYFRGHRGAHKLWLEGFVEAGE